MRVWRKLADIVAAHGAAALVSVHEAKGSAPREAGACMAVRPDGAFHGTIGGGRLEFRMLDIAREMLAQQALSREKAPARFVDQALGPDLGQCCGGRVRILIETFDREDLDDLAPLVAAEEGGGPFEVECRIEDGRVKRDLSSAVGDDRWTGWRETHGERLSPVLLFGAGHVGRALVLALAPLPFSVRWLDDREDAFPAHLPANARAVNLRDVEAEIAQAPPDAMILVMTHDHPLDMAAAAAALRRDFPYVGLIGSATKRARFERRFREMGIAEARIRALVCPIGIPGVADKDPAVIAACVAAQLLQMREAGRAGRKLSPPAASNDT